MRDDGFTQDRDMSLPNTSRRERALERAKQESLRVQRETGSNIIWPISLDEALEAYEAELAADLESITSWLDGIGGCREEMGVEKNFDKCWAEADFVLWGKLFPPQALGPRCYEHASRHVHNMAHIDQYAVVDLRQIRAALRTVLEE